MVNADDPKLVLRLQWNFLRGVSVKDEESRRDRRLGERCVDSLLPRVEYFGCSFSEWRSCALDLRLAGG
jgi:hypothetical protein